MVITTGRWPIVAVLAVAAAVALAGCAGQNQSPTADFSHSPSEPNVNESVTFDASESSDEDGEIAEYNWTFPDGSTAQGQQVEHQFAEPGEREVELEVIDNNDTSATATVTVNVQNQSPKANVQHSPESPNVNETVTLDASGSSDPDSKIAEFNWTFPDGSTAQGAQVEYQFSEAGEHEVQLEIVDNFGASTSVTRTISAQASQEASETTDEQAAEESETSEDQKPASESEATGNIVQQVTVTQGQNASKAIDRLKNNDIQVYAQGVNQPSIKQEINTSDKLAAYRSYGSYTCLTFNPVGPTFKNGKFNPFGNKRIREAMNWLIDRKHIANDLYGGLAEPRFTALTTAFPDYARLIGVARQLEIKYGHQPEKAKRIITEQMKQMGAQKVDGTWQYDGEPVTLKFLIRTEDAREKVGDYVSRLLADMGFKIERMYKTSKQASPIWIGSDPAAGKWHIYTGGWISGAVDRDQAGNFNFFYTPKGLAQPLWQAYQPSEAFAKVAQKLNQRNYSSLEERNAMMAKALRMSMKNSARVWLVDTIDIWPRRQNVTLAADLAGGISNSSLWPYTLRAKGRDSVAFAVQNILNGPWNPLGGTNFVFDAMLQQATGDVMTLPDPYTGLSRSERVKKATVTVKEGLPVQQSLDWVELKRAPEIQVPEDAWYDWDATNHRFITAGEAQTGSVQAKAKTVIRFDKKLQNMTWHDGTEMSMADLVMPLILTFDRAKKASDLYDESYVPDFKQFRNWFKGLRIVQENPLVIEVYSDRIYLDAETVAAEAAGVVSPYYAYGPAPWHSLALGMMAERNGSAAFSESKAEQLQVDRLNYVAGPTLKILEENRQKAMEQTFIPFKNVLGKYIDAEEARSRYEKLGQWHEQKGHFWVGHGPYYLESAKPVAGVVTLRRYEKFPNPPDKWMGFTEPPIPSVSVSGPQRITSGEKATVDVNIKFEGKPYAVEDINFVKYLVFGSDGELVLKGEAKAVSDGSWQVTLTPEETKQLGTGSNRLEVSVVSNKVSVPASAKFSFVSVSP
ncbi:MAG: PKD domain-containing protein [Candidatus Bipolaricaulia bacterium]